MDERITDLENRVAFQGQMIRDLDEEVRLIAKRVEGMQVHLKQLVRELTKGQEEIGPHDEKPPHY